MPGIVVGVDGSQRSEKALAWAVSEAGLRHAPLTALAVHPVPRSLWTDSAITYPADNSELDKISRAVDEMVQKAVGQLGEARPSSITARAVNGFAAEALIDASRDAELIVVGSRGGGGFARLALGSVSSQVAAHAHCPVVVVPHDR
jgi:nucleotide-binding universal stress UspA family protein